MDKPKVIYTHTHSMEYYSAIKRNEILTHTTAWIKLEDTVLSEIEARHKRTNST